MDGHITNIRASFSRAFLPHTLILLSSIFQFVRRLPRECAVLLLQLTTSLHHIQIGCILLFADKSFSKDAYLYISITNFLFIFMLFVLVSTDSGDFEYLVRSPSSCSCLKASSRLPGWLVSCLKHLLTNSLFYLLQVISVCGVLLLFTLQLAMTATSSVAVAGAVLCYIGCVRNPNIMTRTSLPRRRVLMRCD